MTSGMRYYGPPAAVPGPAYPPARLAAEQMALRSPWRDQMSSATANPVLSTLPQPQFQRPCRQLDPTPQTPSAFARPSNTASTAPQRAMMPPGRPPKRPSDPAEGLSEGPLAPKVKLPRLDRAPEDFSSVVKSKLSTYTRTGQACDRCKVRKIRCDALPQGCSHCTNQSLECYVTDRVTGRAERRGYLQQLEQEKADMLTHIRDLEKLLETKGVEVRPWEWSQFGAPYVPGGITYDAMGNPVQDPTSKDQWSQMGSVWVKNGVGKPQHDSGNYSRYSLLETRPTESYLGVTSDNALLSSIKGTTLSILGMTVDIMSFDAPDMDEPPPGTPIGSPLYNKSVMAFHQSTLNINPPLGNVELPSRQDAFTYSEWYFLMVHPFLPMMHKPSFVNLLTRIYDDPSEKPTVPEMVTVHMVFATIYFQYGIRNREEPEKQSQLNDLSNKHYHWCLSKFFDIVTSQTVTAVQALAMIAVHTRSFPKPGCSSTVANYAFNKAIELNLHRAVKIPGGGTNVENEMRKRVWWCTLGLAVTLNGRLGRPMPITLEEFDVDFPIAIPDEYLSEDGILDSSKIGQCPAMVGLIGFRAVPLYLEMYSNIYSVRRDPSKYVEVVRHLENGMRSIQDNLPDDLKVEKCKPGSQIFALYTQAFCLEFWLCLRHPSVCMTDDPKFCAENTRICEETARKLLKVVGDLLRVKSLDTTWYQLSVYVAAIFSTLVAHWERRFETTPFEIATLREEMKSWMSIVYEIGRLLGTGARLSSDVSVLIDRTISWIEQDMGRKGSNTTTTPSQPATPLIKQQPQSPFPQPSHVKSHTNDATLANGNGASNEQRNGGGNGGNGYYDSSMAAPAPAAYPSSLSYADDSAPTGHGQGGNGLAGGPSPYDPPDSTSYLYAASAAVSQAAAATAAQNTGMAFSSQVGPGVPPNDSNSQVVGADGWRTQQQQPPPAAVAAAAVLMGQQQAGGGNPWHDWTAAIADSQTDRYSANALLTLGTARPGDVGGGGGSASAVGMGGDGSEMAMPGVGIGVGGSSVSQAGQWPLLLFNNGPPSVSGS